ncbi:hypothetical protein [Streptomyces sp. NRRL F-5053]|uniref:hypothetical protein n=1 Tax=Streptomyces sp. NRRL F-5053 TaxID=1463854 RepID=UPI0004CC27CE|nr:hypothetical protein [Streptomyces sp. NRRL F-5053]
MSDDFAEVLSATASTEELMQVDTSFLDAYRRGGGEGLRPEPEKSASAENTPAESESRDAADGLEPEVDHEPATESTVHFGHGPGRHTGTSTATSDASGVTSQGAPAGNTAATTTGKDVAGTALAETASALPPRPDEHDELAPAPLRFTDHQDTVQSSTGGAEHRRNNRNKGQGTAAALPQSGFRISGVSSQPHIKALPENIISALREQLRATVVREVAVSDVAAREFTQRLSQGTLVTAFLLARLDLHLDTDPATARAAELFRSCDPLMGSVAARTERLEQLEHATGAEVRRLQAALVKVSETTAVIEQALAYSIADRTENFLRGSHDINDAPITHKDALFLRDRMRDATKKQARIERDREGRPHR